MSGGSMNYVYQKVADAANLTDDKEIEELLRDVSDLLHAEERWSSGDTGKEPYEKALSQFKEKWFKGNREERLKGYIDEELERVKRTLYAMIGEKPYKEDG